MDPEENIVVIYCLVEDLMEELVGSLYLRSRGPAPVLEDREVIGEFPGLDTDKGNFEFFSGHYAWWLPALGIRASQGSGPE